MFLSHDIDLVNFANLLDSRYVIGQGGQKVNSIRKQSGCKINVPKAGSGEQAIELAGSAEGVEKAKELILEAVKEGGSQNGNSRS